MTKKSINKIGIIGHVDSGKTTLTAAISKALTEQGKDTTKKTMKIEDCDIVEPEREDTPLPAIQGDPVNKFMREMKEGELPPESKGRTLFIFHRETGQRMEHSLKLIMENRKHAFQVWAKTPEYALEMFIKRTKWNKRMKGIPCPIPPEETPSK